MIINIDQVLAFFEGVALIASPCILPVLPLILSTSIDGGKARPMGIIAGFILSFCLFAFFSRWLVSAIGINLDDIKYASLILLSLLGFVMLSTRLSEKFSAMTQGIANVGNRFSGNNEGGFLSGLGIGALIGFIWTPCAGPILAAVLVQVIRQQNNVSGFITLLFFSIGVGLPMLIVALTGRALMDKFSFFKVHAQALRKSLGAIILVSVAFIASGTDPQRLISWHDKTGAKMTTQSNGLINGLSHPYPAPGFSGVETWLNSSPLTMESLKGKVVLIDFWTYSCINCVRTLPYMKAWDHEYRDKGLVIVGVHAPEFEFEKNTDNIKSAIAKNHIEYPVAVDNKLFTWDAFHNRYWPAQYLINKEGEVVYTHFGEGDDDITEHNIKTLLGISGAKMASHGIEEMTLHVDQSPETYLGDMRRERFSTISAEQALPLHHWSAQGLWTVESERIISASADATLWFHFKAQKVFLVMGTSTGKPIKITLILNGKPAGEITVDKHTLYQLVNQKEFQSGMLEIKADAPGLECYAFTFG
ncbi:MAG: cytochrome c biogenesis protein DipZ [Gammaproteobacteria bacterium]